MVESGLIQEADGLRIYGAGISSSKEESLYALDSAKPRRLAFDAKTILQTRYSIHQLQDTYFIIDDFQQLFDTLNTMDWNQE